MKGFFSVKETQSNKRVDGKSYSCASCGLYKSCKSPKLKPVGGNKKQIMLVVSAPNKPEDRQNNPYSGNRYQNIKRLFKSQGIDVEKDTLNTFAIRCLTEKRIENYSIDCCRKFLIKEIETQKPRMVFLFGYEAIYSVIGHRWKKDFGFKSDYTKQTGGKWQGWVIPDQDFQTYLVPVFDIDYLNENIGGVEEVLFERNIKEALEKLSTHFPRFEPPIVEILKEEKLRILNTIDEPYAAFDYETTGLKPHAKGHQIICASIAYSEHNVYAFMMPKSKEARKPFTNFLQRKDIKKVAQNMKYEDNWSNVRLKTGVENWYWDTMLGSHIIDNRTGVTGLKFQSYVQFGIIDYDSEIGYWLKSANDGDGNAINRIQELLETEDGRKKLLTYCAWDSILEFRLFKLQEKIISKTQPRGSRFGTNVVDAMKLFHDGTIALAKAERQGLRIDVDYAEKKYELLTKKINRIEKSFFESNFYKRWKHTTGGKVNLNSSDQLAKYLYVTLKLEPEKTTVTGKGSTDEEALKLLKIPELNQLIDRDKYLKARDTYLKAFVREQVNGQLHPFFNLNIARTYRSSSSNPNFQNIPVRDEEIKKAVRRAIFPREGHQLLEIDFKSIEVAISACYHKDNNMIKYIKNPDTDMHRDVCMQIFKLKDFEKEDKYLRSATKNSFIFPEFYGSYYKNCATNFTSNWLDLPTKKTWDNTMGIDYKGQPISKYLRSVGIKTFDSFVNHLQRIEDDFWGNRFPGYAKWKEDSYQLYLKYGYVPLKTGFVCSGLMSKNDVSNYPIQGSAFHCLLWTFTRLSNELERLDLQTKLVGQIHDSIVMDVYPPELEQVGRLVKHIATIELPKHYTWINVPLSIEAELCGIDESWAEKKEWELSAI